MQTREADISKISESKKMEYIAEILGLFHETHKGNEWLLKEIKKSKIRLAANPTNSFEILKSCPNHFVLHLLKILKGEDIDFDVKTLTKTYHWFYCDIVAGSNPAVATKDQVRKVIALTELISRAETYQKRDPKSTVILSTGDGMAIGFGDSPEKPLRLAIELHKAIFKYNESRRGKEKLLIRVGIDMGPVYFVKDLKGEDNPWGPGIILTRRVMDLAEDMQILASTRIAEDIRKLSPEYKAILHPIGEYSIKHGESLSLYNIYGEGFGNRIAPQKSKIAKKNMEKEIRSVTNFKFNSIDIRLDVTNSKTMMTHHTWTWNLLNIAKEPKHQIFYYIDGDTPKEFAAMNVTVKDERDNKMKILSINTNKPYHKEFNVQLKRPIKQKQKKILKLEYDWEEPERLFFYKFASDCKKFRYVFTIDKGMEPNTRILKVDTETGYKVHASPPPTVKYKGNKIEVTWAKENLKAYEAYQFQW